LTAAEKISESRYHLNKLKRFETGEQNDLVFEYELSSFLSSTQSILWHLLYDFVPVFSFSLGEEERLFPGKFRKLSEGNTKALDFIDWYDNELKKINDDDEFGFLIKKRHESVHKKTTHPDSAMTTTSTTSVTTSYNKMIKTTKGIATIYGFDKNPDIDVVEYCSQFLQRIEDMVNDSPKKE
jgi:hypothetical protein